MKAKLTNDSANFLLFMSLHKEIMKYVDGEYEAKVKLKISGKESVETFKLVVRNGDIDFGEAILIKGLQWADVIEVNKI